MRTWSPRGQTPVLQYHFNWKTLSAYAPELNPVEFLWGYWKKHELPNFCPAGYLALSQHARAALRRMRRRPTLVTAFWEQARLLD